MHASVTRCGVTQTHVRSNALLDWASLECRLGDDSVRCSSTNSQFDINACTLIQSRQCTECWLCCSFGIPSLQRISHAPSVCPRLLGPSVECWLALRSLWPARPIALYEFQVETKPPTPIRTAVFPCKLWLHGPISCTCNTDSNACGIPPTHAHSPRNSRNSPCNLRRIECPWFPLFDSRPFPFASACSFCLPFSVLLSPNLPFPFPFPTAAFAASASCCQASNMSG